MKTPTLVELLEAGVQFGHKKHRSHPKAQEYIFTLREGVYVVDLEKTIEYLNRALEYFKKEISLGKTILFVATKRQAKEVIRDVAESLNMPYVNHRFLGGTLTNFETINRNLTKLVQLEEQTKKPEFENLTKKERKLINDKITKLDLVYGGLRNLKKLPDVLFVIDAKNEENAVKEARMTEIPIIAMCDTDADPTKISFPVPSNDEAPRSINLIMNLFKEAGLAAMTAGGKPVIAETQKKEETPKEEEIKKEEEPVVEEVEKPKIKEVEIKVNPPTGGKKIAAKKPVTRKAVKKVKKTKKENK